MSVTSSYPTRRSWLKLACRSALALPSVGAARWSLAAERVPQLAPVKDFKDMYLLAVSPDSKTLCISPYLGRRTALIIESGTWTRLASVRFDDRPEIASFFRDSRRCYVATFENSYAVMSLTEESQHAIREDKKSADVVSVCWALYDDYLLATESAVFAPEKISLLKVQLPSFEEVLRVPYDTAEVSSNRPTTASVYITADRQKVFCGVSGSLVCRSTDDLKVQWVRPIEERFEFAPFFLSSTPDGSLVASLNLESRIQKESDRSEVGLYDGRTGAKVGSIPVRGNPGIALSPDGVVLAVGSSVWSRERKAEVAIDLFRASTGEFLTRVVHSEASDRNALAAMFGSNSIQFTPDGRYLIVSVNNKIRVWEVN